MHTADEYDGDLSEFLGKYKYQPDLTPRLDSLAGKGAPFSTETVYEIVLWKVNRYPCISDAIRKKLWGLRKLDAGQHRMAKNVVLDLLGCKGVDLPMASTLLRFQVPAVFQIIDRRAYRAAFGVAYPLYPKSTSDKKVKTYFCYLDKLNRLAESKKVEFRKLDRMLYVFDKAKNGSL